MKLPLARRSKNSDQRLENDIQDPQRGTVTTVSLPVQAKPVPASPSDNLVASGFEDQATNTEFGRIEAFDGRYISGWYFDKMKPARGLKISFDGKVLCGTLADMSRKDVVAAHCEAPERCGFFADVSKYGILEQCCDLADLSNRLMITTQSGGKLAHFYCDPFGASDQPRSDKPQSNFDGIVAGVVSGWTTGGDGGSLIHVVVDNIFQGAARAGLHREDIGAISGDYNAGFSFMLSPLFQDGRSHHVGCLFADTGEHLVGSPKDFVIESASLDGADRAMVMSESFADLSRAIDLLRHEIRVAARTGISYFINYSMYQDIIHPSGSTLAALKKRDLGQNPSLFSIVMPTYRTDRKVLAMAIDSVVAQTDRHWELVISDSSSSPQLRDYLRSRAEEDSRIRVIFNDERLGISDNTNVALRAAKGEYVGFMDHDDELAPEAISLNRAAFATGLYDILYSDEDKIDPNGNFVDPHYKSAFDIDLLLCMNYMCHLVFVRRSSLFKTELARRRFDGAQDWDLLLQLTRRVAHKRIGHIPRVLYHWRMIPGSTAAAIGEKSYAVNAGLEAVKVHLAVTEAEADAAPLGGGLPYVDVRWRTKPGAKVSLIVPTKDRIDLVVNCVNSVLLTAGDVDFEILIIDNNSTMASNAAFAALTEDPRIRVVEYSGTFNYSAINNFATRQARGDYLLLLNNDVFFTRKGWLAQMLGVAQRPDVGVVGLKLFYPDNTIQHCGVVLGVGGVAGHAFVRLSSESLGYFARTACTHEVSGVTAACLLVSAEAFFAVGGLDEEQLTIAFNDVDLCMKIQAHGMRNILVATTFAYHAESLSRGYEDTLEKIARFESETATMKTRWGKALKSDRFYSPNFDLFHAPYTVIDLPAIAEQEVMMADGVPVR